MNLFRDMRRRQVNGRNVIIGELLVFDEGEGLGF